MRLSSLISKDEVYNIDIGSVLDAAKDHQVSVQLFDKCAAVKDFMDSNLESEGVQLDTLNVLSSTIIMLGEVANVDTSLLSKEYQDKDVAISMLNMEGVSAMKKIKDALAAKITKTTNSVFDFSKRLTQSVKGKSQIDTLKNIFKNSIRHNIELKQSDYDFVERSFRSYIAINKIDSITALISSLKRDSGHIDDVMKCYDILNSEDVTESTLRDIRDLLWKNLEQNKADVSVIDFIYKESDFSKTEINSIKDRSIKTFISSPYKDGVLVLMVGAVDATIVDNVFKLKRVTGKRILKFEEPVEFKNILSISVAKDLTSEITKELDKLTKDLTKMQKYSMANFASPNYKKYKSVYLDLHDLAMTSIIDRYALLKDALIVLDRASDLA